MSSPIAKTLRFEVLKRDRFTCQYCGAKAPDVLLHVDHVHPESKGGDATILNLVTACAGCNLGKSDRLLSDDAAINKQHAQMEHLAERREQVQMLIEWRAELAVIDDEMVAALGDAFTKATKLKPLESDAATFRRLLKSYSLDEVYDGIEAAADQYIKTGSATNEVASRLMKALPAICAARRSGDHVLLGHVAYSFGIVRSRFPRDAPWAAKSPIEKALRRGVAANVVKQICREGRSVGAIISALEGA
jgi:hypothetical protein